MPQRSSPQISRQCLRNRECLTAAISGYSADDVTVRPADNQLLLLNKENVVIPSYDLPENVDPFTVEAMMFDNGTLMVRAPLRC